MTTPSDTTKRLHITPFTPDLLPAILPASLRSSATEISFHHIPTFPENDYGYVTLPAMDAEKVKKKLNGSILKGRKFKVESARPQKRNWDEDDAAEAVSSHKPSSDEKQKKKKSKKQKDEFSLLEGYELPPDRQVKRGWTESTDALQERRKGEKKRKEKDDKKSKTQAKSKYTEKSECLFRAQVPPNRSAAEEKSEKKSKKKKSAQDSVVHEFSNNTSYPSFLRAGDDRAEPTTAFEEGKGWVDGSGKVKEEVSSRIRTEKYRPGAKDGVKEKRKPVKVDAKDKKTGSKKSKSTSPAKEPESTEESEDWTSSSGSSSSDDGTTDSESEDNASSSSDESDTSSSDDKTTQASPSKKNSLETVTTNPESIQTQDEGEKTAEKDAAPKEVHPLEALFKRPAPGTAPQQPEPEASGQFSFFGQGDIEESEEEGTQAVVEPHTPFTKRDLQSRGLRSAAPTPDTAMIGRSIKWNKLDEDDSMDVDDEPYVTTPVPKGESVPKDESDFSKWFWENRGDNNRAWKKRRRDAAKEQRQRDNRSKGTKGKS